MKTIDHDPKERRVTKGETIFVTAVTIAVVGGISAGLRWIAYNEGLGWFFIAVAISLIVIFASAFWLEAQQRQRR